MLYEFPTGAAIGWLLIFTLGPVLIAMPASLGNGSRGPLRKERTRTTRTRRSTLSLP